MAIDKKRCQEVGLALVRWAKYAKRVAPEYSVPTTIQVGSREHASFLFFTANVDQALTLRRLRPVACVNRTLKGAEALWYYSRRLVELAGFLSC